MENYYYEKEIIIEGYEVSPYNKSRFTLRCICDGEIIEEKYYGSFNDLLIDASDFYKRNLEKVEYDSRFDKLTVEINDED